MNIMSLNHSKHFVSTIKVNYITLFVVMYEKCSE